MIRFLGFLRGRGQSNSNGTLAHGIKSKVVGTQIAVRVVLNINADGMEQATIYARNLAKGDYSRHDVNEPNDAKFAIVRITPNWGNDKLWLESMQPGQLALINNG